jgi:hypothetical protein
MTKAMTTITCIKSEFAHRLRQAYPRGIVIDARAANELNEVIEGLVKQANEHRGTFSGHSAYLDLDFTVTPDKAMPGEHARGAIFTPDGADAHNASERAPITIELTESGKAKVAEFLQRKTQPKTMADYQPGAAVRRMLSELSYLSAYNVSSSALRMVRTSVDAECGEQGITEHLVMPLNEINTWIAEQVHEAIADRN